jgi:hypothetical protein
MEPLDETQDEDHDILNFLNEITEEKRARKLRKIKMRKEKGAKEEDRYLTISGILFNTYTYPLHPSARKFLSVIQSQGWENISCQPLQIDVDNQPPTPKGFSSSIDYQELKVLKRFISDEFLNNYLLPAVNSNLKDSRKHLKSSGRYHNDVTIITWWRWFTRYLLEHEFNNGKIKKDIDKWDAIRHRLINENRYSAILAAHDVGLSQLKSIFQALRVMIQQNINFGTNITIDERVISYHGQDMKEEGLGVNIPGKPHPYGLLEYIAAQVLPRSNIPILIDFEPRITGNKLSPKQALLSLTNKIELVRRKKCHFLCDSAFAAVRSLSEFNNITSVLTIAVNNSAACGLKHLYQLARHDLPISHSRTYRSTSYIVQVLQKEGIVMSVATNAWSVKNDPQDAQTPRLSYKTAVAILENDSAAAIISAFSLPQETNHADIVGVIKKATGHDISMPCPDSNGVVKLTKETIKRMKLPQLNILFNLTPRCKGKKKRKREDIEAMILANHPKAKEVSGTYKDLRNINAMFDELLSPLDNKSPIVDHYSDYYGLVDHLNRAYYQHFKPAGHKTWKKLLLLSSIYDMVMNGWGIYEEHRLSRASRRRRGKGSVNVMAPPTTLTKFILNVCQQVVDQLQ